MNSNRLTLCKYFSYVEVTRKSLYVKGNGKKNASRFHKYLPLSFLPEGEILWNYQKKDFSYVEVTRRSLYLEKSINEFSRFLLD